MATGDKAALHHIDSIKQLLPSCRRARRRGGLGAEQTALTAAWARVCVLGRHLDRSVSLSVTKRGEGHVGESNPQCWSQATGLAGVFRYTSLLQTGFVSTGLTVPLCTLWVTPAPRLGWKADISISSA